MSKLSRMKSSDAAMNEVTESATSPSSNSRKSTRKEENKGGKERRNSFAEPMLAQRMVRQLKSSSSKIGISRKNSKKSSINTLNAAAAIDQAGTPLMFDDHRPPESSSRLRDIDCAEVIRRDRHERRKTIDKRMLNFHETVTNRLSQMEDDAKDVDFGNCTRCGQLLIKTIHLTDATIGLLFVVYGSLIMTQFDSPAIMVGTTSLIFGSVMVMSSFMGVIGFTTKRCNRRGLLVSAYTAPFIVWFYTFVITSTIVAHDVHLEYLTEHMSVLYLNAARIQTIEHLLPLFYVVLASLAVVEGLR